MKLILLLGSFWWANISVAGRPYHFVTIDQFVNAHHTHVFTEGWVTYKLTEDDKDKHVRVCDDPQQTTMNALHCIVAECIPRMDCKFPKLGSHVQVYGIRRFDDEVNHGWWEIHPVERIEVIK